MLPPPQRIATLPGTWPRLAPWADRQRRRRYAFGALLSVVLAMTPAFAQPCATGGLRAGRGRSQRLDRPPRADQRPGGHRRRGVAGVAPARRRGRPRRHPEAAARPGVARPRDRRSALAAGRGRYPRGMGPGFARRHEPRCDRRHRVRLPRGRRRGVLDAGRPPAARHRLSGRRRRAPGDVPHPPTGRTARSDRPRRPSRRSAPIPSDYQETAAASGGLQPHLR